ncbi:MAG: hypothetical protein ACSHYB_13690 [Roseibacillus sp.]
MSEEFFIGWQGKAPQENGRFLKRLVIVTALIVAVTAVAVSAMQRTVAKDAKWDLETKEFTGILLKEPAPILIGDDNEVRFLVNPLKFGFDEETAAKFHLKRVTLNGTLISRDGQEMIEGLAETVREVEHSGDNIIPALKEQGPVVLEGEIVDSKCYLGVMNPGNLKPHRACAINCISGGIPPVLVVRDPEGNATYTLMVGEQGQPINDLVLPLVAEPVRIQGQLKSLGKLPVVYVDEDGIELIQD